MFSEEEVQPDPDDTPREFQFAIFFGLEFSIIGQPGRIIGDWRIP